MNEVANVFNYGGYNVRTVVQDGEPWFVAADICEVLEIAKVAQAMDRLDDDEKLMLAVQASGQKRDMWAINESGLYSLVMTSRKAEAKAFKKWVTSEVLPTIRKHGKYEIEISPQEYMAKALLMANQILEGNKVLIEQLQPKAQVYDDIVESDELLKIDEVAKMFDVKPMKFRNWLRQMRFVRADGLPAAGMMDRGFMQVKETPWDNGEFRGISSVPYFTQKGMLKIKQYADKYLHANEHNPYNLLK